MASQKKALTVSGSVSKQRGSYWGYVVTGAMGDISVAATVGSVAAAGTDYVHHELITLAGGTETTPAVLQVDTTKLISTAGNALGSGYDVGQVLTLAGGTSSVKATLTLVTAQLASATGNAAGTGYAPNNVITTAATGGTASPHATINVDTTKVVSATVAAGGTGNLGDGAGVIVQGTTGTGTKFRASVTIAGNAIASVQSISLAGSYTVNPTAIATEPVTYISGAASGTTLTGAQLNVVMGVNTFTILTRGSYTVIGTALTQNGATTPTGGTGATFSSPLFAPLTWTYSNGGSYTAETATFTQFGASVPGGGTGATFNAASFGVLSASISVAGAYTATPADAVAQASSSGAGTGATFNMTWSNSVSNGATIYDNNSAASGTVIDVVPDNALAGTSKVFDSPIPCDNGIYASIAGGGTILFLYD